MERKKTVKSSTKQTHSSQKKSSNRATKSLSVNEINKKYFWDFVKVEEESTENKKKLFSIS